MYNEYAVNSRFEFFCEMPVTRRLSSMNIKKHANMPINPIKEYSVACLGKNRSVKAIKQIVKIWFDFVLDPFAKINIKRKNP